MITKSFNWSETQQYFPHQWVVVEAVQAHSQNNERILDKLVVIESFKDSRTAWQAYAHLHHHSPEKELYVLHTDRQTLNIQERRWLGVRTNQ